LDISLQILLLIAILVLLAKGTGGLLGRIGLPVVLGELLAGVILGPTAINVWRFAWFSSHGGPTGMSAAAVIKVLADLGVVVLMFLAGLETDIQRIKSSIGPAFWAACGGVLLPLLGGAWLSRAEGYAWREALFIGTIITATSVSVTAQTLMNLGQLRSKTGSAILGAAVIDDVMGLVVLSLVIAMEMRAVPAGGSAWLQAAGTILRVLVVTAILFWLGPWLVRATFRHARQLHGPHVLVAVALALAFIFAFLAQYAGGMAAITGAYLAGLFVALTPTHGEVIGDLRAMTNSFFGPLFFATVGLEINAWKLAGRLGFFALILLVAWLGKVAGCGLPVLLRGFSRREALRVGVGMIPRGEVGLITASIGYSAGLVHAEVYSLAVAVVLASDLVTPVLLRLVYPPTRAQHAGAVEPVIAEIPPSGGD